LSRALPGYLLLPLLSRRLLPIPVGTPLSRALPGYAPVLRHACLFFGALSPLGFRNFSSLSR
jgi:hypothetical protein